MDHSGKMKSTKACMSSGEVLEVVHTPLPECWPLIALR